MLYVVVALALINCVIENLSYAAMLAGVQMQRLSVAQSIYKLMVLVAGVCMAIQTPVLFSLADDAVASRAVNDLVDWIRIVLAARLMGYAAGVMVLPHGARLIRFGIDVVEHKLAALRALTPRRVLNALRQDTITAAYNLADAVTQPIPAHILTTAILVAAIYIVVDVAALYASVLSPERVRTAIGLPTIVKGLGTIIFVLVIEPFSSLRIDRANGGDIPVSRVVNLTTWLAIGKAGGAALTQLLFMPITQAIIKLSLLV